jgi:sarcosine oxidase subunit beta
MDTHIGRHEIAIVGGGVIGSSVAMALAERSIRPVVLDIDLAGRLSSSERNAGGVRATWWNAANIVLCRQSIEYYEKIREAIGFRQKGYLILYEAGRWDQATSHLKTQRDHGLVINDLSPAEVHRMVPEIDQLDGIAGATFSPNDGLLNPNLLKEHYRERSRELGAEYLDRTYVHALEADATEVRLHCWRANAAVTDEELARMMTSDGPAEPAAAEPLEIIADAIVIASGAWSANLDRMLGLKKYTRAVRRQLCVVDCRATDLARYGMIFDTSGAYCHNDGPHILAGYSPPEEPAGYSFEYDGEAFFQNEVWPRLYHRMSCMERLRHVTGWAGLYEVTPDRSAIVGRALPRVYEAHSFSAHGVMQSYGAGQALADLIVGGSYGAFDASALGRERFESGRLVYEELHY